MATFEEKLQADRDWLKDQLDTFELHLKKGLQFDGAQLGEQRYNFRDVMHGIAFGEDHTGKVLNKSATYTFHQFDIDEEEETAKKKKERDNMLALWLKYLREDMKGLDDEESKARRLYLQDVLIRKTEQFLKSPDATYKISFRKIAPGPAKYKMLFNEDENPAIEIKPTENTNPHNVGPVAGPYAGWILKPSYVNSGIIAGFFGLSTGAAVGMLMRSASNIAICSAIGAFGLTGFPALLVAAGGAALAGAAAGVVTGSIRSAMKNHEAIGAAMGSVGLMQKPKVFWEGFRQSLDTKQLVGNALVGAAGGLLGFGLTHIDAFTSCLSEQFGWASIAQNDIAENTNVAPDAPQEDAPAASPQPAAPQMDDIGNTSFTHEDLLEEFGVGEQADTPSAQNGGTAWPSYISDPEGSFDEFVDNLNGDDTPTPITETPAAEAPSETVATVSAPADPAGIAPENDQVIVKSGDNLTRIVEREYGVDELSNADSDGDGIRDFDEIMAAVAKANGLEGNQQNWLKVNWELAMPEVQVANAADNINRAALDANWRAGDVTFSDAPKMAA